MKAVTIRGTLQILRSDMNPCQVISSSRLRSNNETRDFSQLSYHEKEGLGDIQKVKAQSMGGGRWPTAGRGECHLVATTP